MTKKMTTQEERDFYAEPENQEPQGPPAAAQGEAHRVGAGQVPTRDSRAGPHSS